MAFDFCLMTPLYSGVDGVTCWSVERAHQELPALGVSFIWFPGTEGRGDALIARSRSIALTAFLEYGPSDYIIFLDSDIVFDPWHLKRLNDHQKAGYDLVGGVYPVRSGVQIASYWWNGKAPEGPPGLYEIQFLSTGFMGISKRLVQRMVDELKLPLLHGNDPQMRSYPFFEDHSGYIEEPDELGSQHIWISEDWDFCEKARKLGVKPYIDTTILLGHQGTKVVTLNDVAAHQRERQREDAMKRQSEWQEKPPPDWVTESTKGVKS